MSKRSEALRKKIKNIVNSAECFGRFSTDIEGREEAEEDYINQILQAIKEAGMVWLAEDQSFPRILVELEWTPPEAVRQYRELLKKANFKRVEGEQGQ